MIFADAEALAGYLQNRCGVRKGDRVLIDMQNCPQFVTAFQAVLRADAVVVPVNPMNMAAELEHYIADSGASVAIIGDELVERFASLANPPQRMIVARYADAAPFDCKYQLPEVMLRPPADLPAERFTRFDDAIAATEQPSAMTAGDDDLAVMPYTSGTTGHPKGCMQLHRSLKFTAIAQAIWYGLDHDSVVTAFTPLFHVAGMQASMGGGLYAGATLLLLTRWNRDRVAPLFVEHGVTFWSAAPTMIVDVMAGDQFDERTFEKLTVLTGGGASMPTALAERLEKRYGLSETMSATHINPTARPKPQCLGIPIFDTYSLIVKPETTEELPNGEVGELLIAGPQLMRATGTIRRPAECEALLYRHPDVQECWVIAVSDPYRGETVKAFVTLRPQARGRVSEDDIISFARGVMAAYKVPRAVAFVDQLPRSGSNKIDWRRLQEQEQARA